LIHRLAEDEQRNQFLRDRNRTNPSEILSYQTAEIPKFPRKPLLDYGLDGMTERPMAEVMKECG
jgi:hypothetical protein